MAERRTQDEGRLPAGSESTPDLVGDALEVPLELLALAFEREGIDDSEGRVCG